MKIWKSITFIILYYFFNNYSLLHCPESQSPTLLLNIGFYHPHPHYRRLSVAINCNDDRATAQRAAAQPYYESADLISLTLLSPIKINFHRCQPQLATRRQRYKQCKYRWTGKTALNSKKTYSWRLFFFLYVAWWKCHTELRHSLPTTLVSIPAPSYF